MSLPRQAGSMLTLAKSAPQVLPTQIPTRSFLRSLSWSTRSGRLHSQSNPRATQSANSNEADRVSLRLNKDHRRPAVAPALRRRVRSIGSWPSPPGRATSIRLRSSLARPAWAAIGSARACNSFRNRRDSCAAIAALLSARSRGCAMKCGGALDENRVTAECCEQYERADSRARREHCASAA